MADESKRHQISVACPECGNIQSEPALVVSTQCRACGENYQVQDGKGVSRKRPATRLAIPRPPGEEEPAEAEAPRLRPFEKPAPAAPAKRGLFERLFQPVKPPREVSCFNCGYAYKVTGNAQSTQCPKCSSYISLLDYEITEAWNKRIQTRGDVVIQKGGVVSGTTIQCHNLIVLGKLAGSVDCSGDFIIRSHGKIMGKVRCHHLRVERGARVEFLNPVTAASAYIDGDVQGQLSCTGAVTLEKRTHLQGFVRAASLIVKPGAKHTGAIEMVQPAESE